MKHERAQPLLPDFALHLLDPAERQEVAAHLGGCDTCGFESQVYGDAANALCLAASVIPEAIAVADPLDVMPDDALDRIANSVFRRVGVAHLSAAGLAGVVSVPAAAGAGLPRSSEDPLVADLRPYFATERLLGGANDDEVEGWGQEPDSPRFVPGPAFQKPQRRRGWRPWSRPPEPEEQPVRPVWLPPAAPEGAGFALPSALGVEPRSLADLQAWERLSAHPLDSARPESAFEMATPTAEVAIPAALSETPPPPPVDLLNVPADPVEAEFPRALLLPETAREGEEDAVVSQGSRPWQRPDWWLQGSEPQPEVAVWAPDVAAGHDESTGTRSDLEPASGLDEMFLAPPPAAPQGPVRWDEGMADLGEAVAELGFAQPPPARHGLGRWLRRRQGDWTAPEPPPIVRSEDEAGADTFAEQLFAGASAPADRWDAPLAGEDDRALDGGEDHEIRNLIEQPSLSSRPHSESLSPGVALDDMPVPATLGAVGTLREPMATDYPDAPAGSEQSTPESRDVPAHANRGEDEDGADTYDERLFLPVAEPVSDVPTGGVPENAPGSDHAEQDDLAVEHEADDTLATREPTFEIVQEPGARQPVAPAFEAASIDRLGGEDDEGSDTLGERPFEVVPEPPAPVAVVVDGVPDRDSEPAADQTHPAGTLAPLHEEASGVPDAGQEDTRGVGPDAAIDEAPAWDGPETNVPDINAPSSPAGRRRFGMFRRRGRNVQLPPHRLEARGEDEDGADSFAEALLASPLPEPGADATDPGSLPPDLPGDLEEAGFQTWQGREDDTSLGIAAFESTLELLGVMPGDGDDPHEDGAPSLPPAEPREAAPSSLAPTVERPPQGRFGSWNRRTPPPAVEAPPGQADAAVADTDALESHTDDRADAAAAEPLLADHQAPVPGPDEWLEEDPGDDRPVRRWLRRSTDSPPSAELGDTDSAADAFEPGESPDQADGRWSGPSRFARRSPAQRSEGDATADTGDEDFLANLPHTSESPKPGPEPGAESDEPFAWEEEEVTIGGLAITLPPLASDAVPPPSAPGADEPFETPRRRKRWLRRAEEDDNDDTADDFGAELDALLATPLQPLPPAGEGLEDETSLRESDAEPVAQTPESERRRLRRWLRGRAEEDETEFGAGDAFADDFTSLPPMPSAQHMLYADFDALSEAPRDAIQAKETKVRADEEDAEERHRLRRWLRRTPEDGDEEPGIDAFGDDLNELLAWPANLDASTRWRRRRAHPEHPEDIGPAGSETGGAENEPGLTPPSRGRLRRRFGRQQRGHEHAPPPLRPLDFTAVDDGADMPWAREFEPLPPTVAATPAPEPPARAREYLAPATLPPEPPAPAAANEVRESVRSPRRRMLGRDRQRLQSFPAATAGEDDQEVAGDMFSAEAFAPPVVRDDEAGSDVFGDDIFTPQPPVAATVAAPPRRFDYGLGGYDDRYPDEDADEDEDDDFDDGDEDAKSRWRVYAILLAVTSVALFGALVVGFFFLVQYRNRGDELQQVAEVAAVSMTVSSPSGAAVTGYGFYDPAAARLLLVISGLPVAPTGRTFVIWADHPKGITPVGSTAGDRRSTTTTLQLGLIPQGTTRVFFTEEASGPRPPAPTGPVVIEAKGTVPAPVVPSTPARR